MALAPAVLVVGSVCWPTPSLGVCDDKLRKVQREFVDEIQPILNQHCLDCHGADHAEAGLDLSNYKTIDQLLNARKIWKKVQVRIAANEMPPEDEAPIDEVGHRRILDWIDQLLSAVDCSEIDPGQVTIRRLNRTEYRNSVNSLLGIDYQPAESFPGDDVGYGFDNIADVLSLPPILMEKYLDASEQIVTQSIVDPNVPQFSRTLPGSELKPTRGSRAYDLSHVLTTSGQIDTQLEIPDGGKYRLQIVAFGDQAGDDDVQIEIRVDGESIGKRKITGTVDSQQEIELMARLKPGRRTIGVAFTNDYYDESQPPGQRDRNLHLASLTIAGPIGKIPPSHKRLFGDSKPELSEELTAARGILNRFASRAYRRPVTLSELDRLMALYQQARQDLPYELAVGMVIQAVLVSPNFLYKIETPAPVGETRFLSDFELATSLSYFLWSDMPDDELLRVAAEGKLKDFPTYQAQVKRMLESPKSSALVDNFMAQWLQLRHLEHVRPDPDLFPGVDALLLQDMAQETRLVATELIGRDASLLELLDFNFSYLNQRLAQHYDVKGIEGDEFQRVTAERLGRVGLMTQASILTLTSNPTRTSPVKRGKWIMENLLGEQPPPPDPAAMKLEDQQQLTGTLRQRMEQHRADPNCAVCHKVMDELGFALENYDAVGRWRDLENTLPIDAQGVLPNGTRFQGALELQQTISEQMRAPLVRCAAEKTLTYALGRGLEYYDVCTVNQIVERLERNDFRFSELIMGVVTSEPFIKRRGRAETSDDHP